MNKKQRNRKLVAQNKRNRMINRRYSSTIKSLFKLFLAKNKNFDPILAESKEKQVIQFIVNQLTSLIDKATKKNVIHKNNAARKKSKILKKIKF
jgi:small subunit ribosomal protein S20